MIFRKGVFLFCWKRFYTAIVHRRRAVLAAFVLAAVLSVFASRAVQVDYDINDYLPPDSPSTIALEQMNSAFTGGIPNMRVMVRTSRCPEALDYKEKLAAIDGVEAVTGWTTARRDRAAADAGHRHGGDPL